MISLPKEILSRMPEEKIIRDFSLLRGRIGLFGGSFDPVHRVHIEIAQELLTQEKVDTIIFIPAAQNPLKTVKPVSDVDRLAMVLLAIADFKGMYVSPIELERGELSYTVKTLQQIAEAKNESARLFWIIGSDCLVQLPDWFKIGEIFNLCTIITVQRDQVMELSQWHQAIDNLGLDKENRDQLKTHFIARRPNLISSTGVRNRLLKGAEVDSVPESVGEYIRQRSLYRP